MAARGGLIRDPQFLKYWLSESIGEVGGTIAGLALSLTAVLVLSADALQMGILGAARNLPFLAVGLLAGVLVDRVRRRPVIVATGLGEAAFLALVPLAAFAGVLRMELLYVVAFGAGAMTVIAVVAYQSFLPFLVGRPRLVEANSWSRLSGSVAQIAGPGFGGVLIELITAPLALLATAGSAAVSALLLLWVRVSEPAAAVRVQGRSVVGEIRDGLGIVLGDRDLRAIMLTGTTHNVFSNGMLVALYVLFAVDVLGLSPAEIGLVFAAGGPGSMLGAVVAGRLSRAFGLGMTVGAMQVLTGVARLAVPLAALLGPAFLVLAAGEFLLGVARSVFNINQLSLRQAITPDHQQGRMNASIRFVMWAVVPFGALAGGWLGGAIGLLPTISLGVAGTFAASLWIFLSPVRRLRAAPTAGPAG